MRVVKAEANAIVEFLRAMRDSRADAEQRRAAARKRLFELTKKHPEQTLRYLDGLPKGTVARSELLRELQETANAAIIAKAKALFL